MYIYTYIVYAILYIYMYSTHKNKLQDTVNIFSY